MKCTCIDLGRINYNDAYLIQRKHIAYVKARREEEYLIFVEHNNTFTLGRGADWNNLLISKEKAASRGIEVVEIDRGGDITYHGPGQVVAYPVFNLARHYKDVHRYLHDLEEVVIRTLAEYNIHSHRREERLGVWTNQGKICSIGVGITNWVTYHGLAVNANVDLKYFDMINPCGFKDINVTSMEGLLRREIDVNELKDSMIRHFSGVFDLDIIKPDKKIKITT